MSNESESSKYCQFCKILHNSTELLHRDKQFFAFHDIDKASAKEHVLVCSIEHIETALELPNREMLYRMREVGQAVLRKLAEGGTYRFGFHLRPYNSIDHVHLHCFVEPFSSKVKDKIVYGKMLTPIEKVAERLPPSAKL